MAGTTKTSRRSSPTHRRTHNNDKERILEEPQSPTLTSISHLAFLCPWWLANGAPFPAGLLCKSYAKISKTMSSDSISSSSSSLPSKIVWNPVRYPGCIKHFTSLPKDKRADGVGARWVTNCCSQLAVANCFFPLLFFFRFYYYIFERKTNSCLVGSVKVWLAFLLAGYRPSFKLIVRPNAKINFFTSSFGRRVANCQLATRRHLVNEMDT